MIVMTMTWNQYFAKMALLAAERSTCLRRHVGAVIVKDHQILSTGYNGAPKKVTHCSERGCIRQIQNIPSGEKHELCMGAHAEMNAIAQAACHGVSIKGAFIYVTNYPCSICAKLIVNSGIKKVFYLENYNDPMTDIILSEGGVEIISL